MDSSSGRRLSGHVRVDAVPARLFLRSQDHQHDLVKELKLVELGDRFELTERPSPQALAELIEQVLEQWSDVRESTRHQALAALERGEEVVDLLVPVRDGIAGALRNWLRLLDEADRLCEEGHLLALAAPGEMRTLRRWYVEEITRRLPTT